MKIIDETDPIRRTLSALSAKGSLKPETFVILKGGDCLALRAVIETGYGAARIIAGISLPWDGVQVAPHSMLRPASLITEDVEWAEERMLWGNMVVRYQDISRVFEQRGKDAAAE